MTVLSLSSMVLRSNSQLVMIKDRIETERRVGTAGGGAGESDEEI